MQGPERRSSPTEDRRVLRAAALRPLNLITLGVGAAFFVMTWAWWMVPLAALTYGTLIILNTRDPIFRARVLTGGNPPSLLTRPSVPPERRARWLERGETRESVEKALDVARRVVAAIEEADEVTRAILDDAVPKVEAASERLVTVAENRQKALSALEDLRASNPQDAQLAPLEREVEAADEEISNTLALLLTLRARVVRASMDSGPEARAAAHDLNTSLDGLNLRLEALGETMDPERDDRGPGSPRTP